MSSVAGHHRRDVKVVTPIQRAPNIGAGTQFACAAVADFELLFLKYSGENPLGSLNFSVVNQPAFELTKVARAFSFEIYGRLTRPFERRYFFRNPSGMGFYCAGLISSSGLYKFESGPGSIFSAASSSASSRAAKAARQVRS